MKYNKSMLPATAIVAMSSLIAGCAAIGIGGEPDERWADYKSWTKVLDGETGDPTKFIGTLHGGPTGFRNVYVNTVGLEAVNNGDEGRVFPVGTVLVKEQYATEAAWEAGGKSSKTISVKVSDAGDGADWNWAQSYTSSAAENAGCMGCHGIAKKHDFMFTNGGYAK